MSLIIAHRGASADAPENTMAAFDLAWEQGADGIETDVHLTADSRIVCIHDRDTKKVAGKKLIVAETPFFNDLWSLDVGRWKDPRWSGEHIPLLDEILAIWPPEKKFLIELKAGMPIVEPLVLDLEGSPAAEQLVVMTFDETTIAACKRRLLAIKCHWLVDYKLQDDGSWSPTAEEVAATVHRLGVDGVGTESKPEHVDEEFVRRLRAGGVDEFSVWTVDDPEIARFYIGLGAWAITTNRPGALRAELRIAVSVSTSLRSVGMSPREIGARY